MNCQKCKSTDFSTDTMDGLGDVHVCVECDSTWLSDDGVIQANTFSDGEGRRELQRLTDNDNFMRAFNNPDEFGT